MSQTGINRQVSDQNGGLVPRGYKMHNIACTNTTKPTTTEAPLDNSH